MKSEQFVKGLWDIMVVDALQYYKEMYNNTPVEKVTDPYYKKSINFFNSLSDEQKEIFFEIIKQTEIDTAAGILAILDGVSNLPGKKGDFKLFIEGNKKPINEEGLSDLFLEIDEIERGE